MKITRDTPEHLIVGENPIWVAVITGGITIVFTAIGLGIVFSGDPFGFFFLIGTAVGLLTTFLFVRRVQVIFDRDARTVTIQRKNLMRSSKVVHDLNEIKEAILEGTGNQHRVTLVLTGQSAGRHPLTIAYSNVGDHHNVAGAINRWLIDLHRWRDKADP